MHSIVIEHFVEIILAHSSRYICIYIPQNPSVPYSPLKKKNLTGYGAYVDILRMNRSCSPVEPRYQAQKETSMPRDD